MKLKIRRLLAAVLAATCGMTQAATGPFAGVWTVRQCDADTRQQPCGGFTLVLVQRSDRLCGHHFAATPNYGRVDEGGPTSVIGTVVDNTAVLLIVSGRDPTSYLAKATLMGDTLTWRLVESLGTEQTPGEPVIALDETLQRTHSAQKLAQAARACDAHFKLVP